MVLDPTALERVGRLGGETLITKLVAIFLEDAPGRLEAARSAAAAGDAQALHSALHSLRGSAGNVGAMGVERACRKVESGPDDPASAAAGVARVAAELERAFGALRERAAPRPRPRVAVVEDNADNRLLLRVMLRDEYELAEYETGTAALDGMLADPPAAVLMDIALPGMDGLEVLARMREDPALRAVPVVALTAHAMAGDRERFLAAGFDEYITKPILDEVVLLETLGCMLSGRAT